MTELDRFILEHRNDDPSQMALSAKKYPDVPVAFVARQIDAYSRLKKKIPSWYQQGLSFPVPVSLEQCSSEATARFKASLFSGENFLDLTGGMGVDSYFFKSRFDRITLVEADANVLSGTRHNFQTLGIDNVVFVESSAEQYLQKTEQHFDLIYLDPSRRASQNQRVFMLDDCQPNVLVIKDLLFNHADKTLIKTAPLLDISLAIKQLEHVSQVWIVAYEHDCREILYLLEKNAPTLEQVPIHAVSIDHNGIAISHYTHTQEEEQCASIEYGGAKSYLYEPNAALMKAGAFKSLGSKFQLGKFHVNSHLYTSDELIQDFPGRRFNIIATCKYHKKELIEVIPSQKANFSSRNFPDRPEQVRKRMGFADGGDHYVFATTDHLENKVLLVCLKV